MMSGAHRFHAQLLANSMSWPAIPEHMPQLLEIVESDLDLAGSMTQEVDFFNTAWRWTCNHPEVAWDETTQDIFAIALQTKLERKTIVNVAELLRAWTRGGVHQPREQDRPHIAAFFKLCDQATGCRLLESAPYLSQHLAPETQEELHNDALAYLESGARGRPRTPAIAFAYFNGSADTLTSAQRDYANDILLGLNVGHPAPFAFAKALAVNHPNPCELQLAFLRLAAQHAFSLPGCSEQIKNDCQVHLGPWLQTSFSIHASTASECLLLGALLERASGTPWVDPSVWHACAGSAWERTKDAVPVLESLHGLVWHPPTWPEQLGLLKPLMASLSLPPTETLSLPSEWSAFQL